MNDLQTAIPKKPMTKDQKDLKIADVARVAGVSSASVSRVIHNTSPVSEDIRRRVEAAVQRLGYQARRTPKKSIAEGVILLLTGNMSNPFFTEIIRGAQEEIDRQQGVLSLMQLSPNRQQLVKAASSLPVTGIILAGASPFPELLAWREAGKLPLLVLNRRITQPGISCITVDFEDAYARATRYLINLGHTRIGYVDVASHSGTSQTRLGAFKNVLVEAGIPFRPELYASVGIDPYVHTGFQAASNLLALPVEERPTAILAFNDLLALGIIHAVRTHGLRVPEDISVIGCDDIPMATYAYPPLTTINQPKYEMGKLAVATVRKMAQESQEQTGSFTLMESTLIIRASTVPCTRNGL